jgi:predicted RNA-binding protein YlxR (DUF448 family)
LNEIKHERVPMRSCFACREKDEKSSMLRLVVDKSGVIWPDLLQKAPGRGVYLCMHASCLSALNDKRLGALRSKHKVVLPQWDKLQLSLIDMLEQHIHLQLTRLKPDAAIGRDAVMHRMWENKELLLLLADAAGQALVRQVMDAVQKRGEEGLKTTLLDNLPEACLGDVFQRGKMSVAALIVSKKTKKLQRYCAWYGRINRK